MQAIAGLQVSLRHDNNRTIPATLLSGPNGPLADTSRLSFATIRATPGKNLRITISENHEYNGHGAQGLKIGVAHGFLNRDDKAHTVFQEWFLPNERLREGTLIAEAYVLWNHEAADSDEHRFIVPRAESLAPEEKPRNYIWMEEGLDHGVEPGCIAVCLTRGDLSYAVNSPLPLARFDPPNDFRDPRVFSPIQSEWFRALDGEAGETLAFVFRNLNCNCSQEAEARINNLCQCSTHGDPYTLVKAEDGQEDAPSAPSASNVNTGKEQPPNGPSRRSTRIALNASVSEPDYRASPSSSSSGSTSDTTTNSGHPDDNFRYYQGTELEDSPYVPGQNSSTAAQPKITGRAEEPGTTHEAHNAVKREPDLSGVPVDGTARAPISLSDDDSPPRKKSSASGQKAKDPSAPSARPPITSPSLKRIAPTEPVRPTASRSANPGPGANEDALGEEAKREWEDYRLAARKLALEERRITLERKFGREPDDVTGK